VKAARHFLPLVAMLLLLTGSLSCTSEPGAPNGQTDAWARMPEHPLHTDHSTFFSEPFADGPSVTRACLDCHPDSAAEVMKTTHWNWEGQEVMMHGRDQSVRIGKRNVINNFCIGIQSNWPACTMCHIGYGWEDENFDFNDAARVDCLVCHDNSGKYLKKYQGAGLPDEAVDLLEVARSVGIPRRQNCGSCHFQGGGGNAVKHGDMDETLLFPSARIDVHMGRHDMLCVDCHRTEQHRIAGRAMSVSVDRENFIECTDCHEHKPHVGDRLNAHTERLACQSCHVPHMGEDTGTKLAWDWSEAGQDLDITDEHLYLKIKGRFVWAKKAVPEYYWYNETSTRYILGDRIDPSKPTPISRPLGDRDDPAARIWPFKVHRGKQPYDTVNSYFLVPNVHGDRGFWTRFDWVAALKLGSGVTGLPYSGAYDFAPTEMHFPLSHMVTSLEQTLQCRDCHGKRGRLDWKKLGYSGDPLMPEPAGHDPVYLLDADAEPVLDSGAPLSVAASCGMCHELEEASFVDTHRYHSRVRGAGLPSERQSLMVDGPRILFDQDNQMNCFLCHMEQPNHAARLAAIEDGESGWSVTATLLGTGLVERTTHGYQWNRERISEDGEAELELHPASEANCGGCHGLVHDGSGPLMVELGSGDSWTTEKTGQVFSPQRVRLSAMNLEGKDSLDMPWDVHAERLVSCGDCHYSRGRLKHLAGEVVAADSAADLDQGARRRCSSCHSLADSHAWLPEKQRHLKAVACESCHVPELQMAAQRSIDDTVMWPDGSSRVSYRGINGDVQEFSKAYVKGYRPLLRVGKSVDGDSQVFPYNLVTRWYWSHGESGEPVSRQELRRAWLEGEDYTIDIKAAFDTNRDGRLDDGELHLDNAVKLSLIEQRLRDVGIEKPTIRGEVRAFPIHHNIRSAGLGQRDCTTCHPDSSKQLTAFSLAPYVPGDVEPVLLTQGTREIVLDGTWHRAEDGALMLVPVRGVAESYQAVENRAE